MSLLIACGCTQTKASLLTNELKENMVNMFTSTDIKFDIKSIRVGNKIFGSAGFLFAIIELTLAFFNNKIEALANLLLPTHKQALCKTGSRPSRFIGVSLEHLVPLG